MCTPSSFKTDSKRDATDSIRGYVYQVYQSILSWIQLNADEILVLEGAEDFDVRCGPSVVTTQVKDVASNLTLRSATVIDTLNNYWAHRERNPDYDIVLRFLATSETGQEHGSPFGSNRKGLDYWLSAESDHVDIKPLKAFLLTQNLDPSLKAFVQRATDEELREKLIRRIKWDLGNKPSEAIQYTIEDKLKLHGFKLSINSHYSCQALPHLLKKIVDLLSTKGAKELKFVDFLSCFDDATTVSIPRGKIEAMTSGGSLQQLAGMLELGEMARLVNAPPTIGNPMPIVDGGISRIALVSNLSKLLCEQRIIFLCGSSGLGKTNLASLVAHNMGGGWGWAGFRGMQPNQIKDVLARAAFEMNAARLPPYLVLDDVDLNEVALFEREFIALVFSVINANGMVIVTGPIRPPLQLLPKLWKNETCEATVPYFDEAEIAEMVRAHGLTDGKRVSAWARTIWLTTSGHPQLVHARVRNLSAKDWPEIEFSDLTKPEDIERVRSEARIRLVKEFPTENTRVLAYRLSLINGAFSRETALAVAETPPPTRLPGEAFDALIGPWVEREGENRYRISPLLNGAASNVLSEVDIKAVHGAIAISIINRKSVDQYEVGTAFFHAFMAKHTTVLATLSHKICTTDSDYMCLLYDAMSWFTWIGLDTGQKILPEDPNIDLMLRLAQYKLIASSPESDKAINVIKRIEETLHEIEPSEFKQYSEILAYGIILNSFEVQIPSSMVIRMLSRMIDLSEENLVFKDIFDPIESRKVELPRLGENRPVQLLFSFQGARLSGLDDLSELVTSLDVLPSNKRDQLLRICNSDMDLATHLINRAWWKEVKDNTIDVEKALQVFKLTANKSREWGVPGLTKASLVALSVILDEYGRSHEQALEVLDAADKEFPNEATLVNQRAKVLFSSNRYSEVLPIANQALNLPGLSNVEFVFCCRSAGIAAAKCGDWSEAERLFQLGAEKAMNSDIQKSMGIGLMADAAFVSWKQENFQRSLLTFAEVLDLLKDIPLSEDIRVRHLHATVRHSICWIHMFAQGRQSTDIIEPLPGMCSNQEPHEGIKDHRIIDLNAAWELLAFTEHILGINIGIRERAQAVTGGKKPLVLEGYSRTLALDAIFKTKDFTSLIPTLIGMHEALQQAKALDDMKADGWSIVDIPKLPTEYWQDAAHKESLCQYILVASVICTADNQNIPLPIEKWRTDITNAGALSIDVDELLNVLNGAPPNESLFQQAAAAIFALKRGELAPMELWKAIFRLLNALMNERRWVATALERLLITRLLSATINQRFAFSTPPLACREIEQCCSDQSLNGLSKVATVLDVAAPYLNIRMSPDARQMLKKIIDQESV